MVVLLTASVLLSAACTEAQPDVRTHRISIRAFQYIPAQTTVTARDTVIWINQDAIPHTATADDGAWDTGSVGSQESGQVVVSKPGKHPYVCAFHPNMAGMLVIQ